MLILLYKNITSHYWKWFLWEIWEIQKLRELHLELTLLKYNTFEKDIQRQIQKLWDKNSTTKHVDLLQKLKTKSDPPLGSKNSSYFCL